MLLLWRSLQRIPFQENKQSVLIVWEIVRIKRVLRIHFPAPVPWIVGLIAGTLVAAADGSFFSACVRLLEYWYQDFLKAFSALFLWQEVILEVKEIFYKTLVSKFNLFRGNAFLMPKYWIDSFTPGFRNKFLLKRCKSFSWRKV